MMLAACNETKAPPEPEQERAGVQKISAAEARGMMQELQAFTLLDVRTENEFRERRLKGAILIPDYELKARAETELPDKGKPILVYCRSGRRSARAAEELIALGYKKVYDFGGIASWSYEVVEGD